jgi:hypothetical protein
VTQTVVIDSQYRRDLAHRLVAAAPVGAVMTISPAKRSSDQNARFWAMLSDISRAKPEGRVHTPEAWKALFMHALGHSVRFEMGLNGEPFPVGFRSSQLTKAQMSDLMEFMSAWAAERGVIFSNEARAA